MLLIPQRKTDYLLFEHLGSSRGCAVYFGVYSFFYSEPTFILLSVSHHYMYQLSLFPSHAT